MCDTIAVVSDEGVLFAKNSDRDANEGQNLEWHSSRNNKNAEPIKCTWIEIPDVRETYATLLSRPFWIWGAEIGANEKGVTIGNEAVFTKERYEDPGLIGMDLLRLALERAPTADAACQVITSLLEKYGQGGGCGHENRSFTYHNSFIVADPTEAFVLETAGRKWAIEKISGARTISNALTIPKFRDQYSDTVKTWASGSRRRQCRTQELANTATKPADLMAILRDHGEGDGSPGYAWLNGGLTVPCVHGGGGIATGQSTASWVALLRPGQCQHWATGTSAPCTGIFKPLSVNNPIDLGPKAEDTANESLWWRHEKLHRTVMRNPQRLAPLFMEERDATEERWLAKSPSSESAFEEAGVLLHQWTQKVLHESVDDLRPRLTRRYWDKRNQRAGLEFSPAAPKDNSSV